MLSQPGKKSPTHDLVLERLDTGEKIGFVFAGSDGQRKPDVIRQSPYPRNSLQTFQGGSDYDTQTLPYRTITQQDWIGGRGQLRLEADITRFFDSSNLQTWLSGKFFLGGQPNWCSGYEPSMVLDTPGDVTWTKITGNDLYLGRAFQTTSAVTRPDLYLWVRRVGSPGTMTVSIRTATASPGNPNAVVEAETLTAANALQDFGAMVRFVFSTNLSTATWYFIVVTATTPNDASNYWEIGTSEQATGQGRRSANGSSWSSDNTDLWYLVGDNNNDVKDIIPFVYKHQAYAVVRMASKANATLYMAGDRGAADANTGALSTLEDASKSWATNAYAGDIVLLTAGIGTEETKPWRTIASNDSNTLTVTEPWLVEHTTDTEYVILGDGFTSMLDLGGDVTDIALGGDYVYFARGEDENILRYQAFNNAGTWTARSDAENVKGVHVLAQREPFGQEYLWVSRNDDNNIGPHVARYDIPIGWGDLYQKISTVARTDKLWSEWLQANVVGSVQSPDIMRFQTNLGATGVIAVHDLDGAVDLRTAPRVGMNLRHTGGSAPAVTLKLSDALYNDRKFQASKVLLARAAAQLPAGVILATSGALPSSLYWYDSSGTAFYNMGNGAIGDAQYATRVTMDTSDILYIGHTSQFNTISWVLSSANNNASAVAVDFWGGAAWETAGAVTDNTSSGGASLAQSGTMTWDVSVKEQWQPGRSSTETSLSSSLYWVKVSFSGAGMPMDVVEIDRIMLENSTRPASTQQTTNLSYAVDADDALLHILHRFGTSDWLYVLGNDPFDKVTFQMGATVNAVASNPTMEYFDGEEFSSVTNLDDTTDSVATKTLSGNGSMTFDLPHNMSLITVNGIEGYCVRIGVSTQLTDDIQIVEMTVTNRRHPVYTEITQSLVGNETPASSANAFGDVIDLASGDILYVAGDNRFDMLSWVINETINNDAAVGFTLFYFDGENFVNGSLSDGTVSGSDSLAQSGDMTFSSGTDLMQRSEIDGTSAYWVALEATGAFDPVLVHGLTLQRQNTISIALSGPTLATGLWYWHTGAMPIYASAQSGVDMSAIVSVGVSIDALPTYLDFRGGLLLVSNDGLVISGFGPGSDRINGLELYGQLRQNPWVLTEGGVFEVQTQNQNNVVPLPLSELSTLRHPHNGRVSVTNDTYLYFNLGSHIQRYYNQTLDNVGWTRDEGLPANRSGEPTFLLSAPGGIYAGVDAGSGYSSVMFGQSRAWHTLYMAPKGVPVQAGCIQSVPGATLDRMWINVGNLLMWLPIPSETFDPTHDDNYLYCPEGDLITSWISASLYSIKKLAERLGIYSENLTTTKYIKAFYQEESGDWDGAWTPITALFDESPYEEHDLSSTMLDPRRIRFRINLRTNDNAVSPIVFAYNVETLLWFPTKYTYSFQHRIADWDENKQGIKQKDLEAYNYIRVTLRELGNTPVKCRVHCYDPVINGLIVAVQPSNLRPIYDPETVKAYILETTLIEV